VLLPELEELELEELELELLLDDELELLEELELDEELDEEDELELLDEELEELLDEPVPLGIEHSLIPPGTNVPAPKVASPQVKLPFSIIKVN
jgi:hypothetical protein